VRAPNISARSAAGNLGHISAAYTCELAGDDLPALRAFYAQGAHLIRLTSGADDLDISGVAVRRGMFDWSIKRQP
jgi:hypothetical protein